MIYSDEYEEMDRLAIQIRTDYSYFNDYLDIFELAEKHLHIKLISYSELAHEQRLLLINEYGLQDAISIVKTSFGIKESIIYYNDKISDLRTRFSIAHEIKHIICNETEPDEDEEILADHFAKVLLAPSCLVLEHLNKNIVDISDSFGVSKEVANYLLSSGYKRITSPYFNFKDYELDFIKCLDLFKQGGKLIEQTD